jgi:hypothetical protein
MKPDRSTGILAALDYLGMSPDPLLVIGRATYLPRRRKTRRVLSRLAAIALTVWRKIKP